MTGRLPFAPASLASNGCRCDDVICSRLSVTLCLLLLLGGCAVPRPLHSLPKDLRAEAQHALAQAQTPSVQGKPLRMRPSQDSDIERDWYRSRRPYWRRSARNQPGASARTAGGGADAAALGAARRHHRRPHRRRDRRSRDRKGGARLSRGTQGLPRAQVPPQGQKGAAHDRRRLLPARLHLQGQRSGLLRRDHGGALRTAGDTRARLRAARGSPAGQQARRSQPRAVGLCITEWLDLHPALAALRSHRRGLRQDASLRLFADRLSAAALGPPAAVALPE